jgi:hypothetical protein
MKKYSQLKDLQALGILEIIRTKLDEKGSTTTPSSPLR